MLFKFLFLRFIWWSAWIFKFNVKLLFSLFILYRTQTLSNMLNRLQTTHRCRSPHVIYLIFAVYIMLMIHSNFLSRIEIQREVWSILILICPLHLFLMLFMIINNLDSFFRSTRHQFLIGILFCFLHLLSLSRIFNFLFALLRIFFQFALSYHIWILR